ncbi:unnamed protein product [Rotaria sordida]|uniref:Uncharacterized protein n=1 Tax=Rotaria sordida TaxID=392033 RepID=A0A815HKV9_9BILA|nr:unnamed protein product [Rotaria sordida]CAF3904293.1 unnamed protein product [Rotaria sordida]
MSYILLYLVIASGYIIGAPIFEESIQYRLVECISTENETLSKNIVELSNINETCIKVNKSSSSGDQVYLYILPQIDSTIQIQITTDDCSLPLPDLYLSLCNDDIDYNYTQVMVTFPYTNLTSIYIIDNNENSSTTESILSTDRTDPTLYQTLHYIDHNSDEDEDENKINDKSPSYLDEYIHQMDNSSEEDID